MTDPESTIDVGIDIGMRRLAYGWPAWGIAGSIDLGSKPGPSRDWELRELQDWLVAFVPDGVQLWVDQAFAGKGAVAMAQRLTETISAVMTAQRWKLAPQVVHQATWKSAIIGNHQANKDEIRGYLEQHYPDLAAKCSTEDEYDAMVIGLYGASRTRGLILPPEKKPKRRRKA